MTSKHLDDFLKLKNIDFKLPRGDGATAFLLAVMMGDLDAAQKLYEKEPSLIEIPENEGRTPLHAAVKLNKPELVKFLLSKGAKKDGKDTSGKLPVD